MTKRDELLQVLSGLSDEAIVRVIAFAREEADRSDLAGYPPALANAPLMMSRGLNCSDDLAPISHRHRSARPETTGSPDGCQHP
jgi:hypothetical protein